MIAVPFVAALFWTLISAEQEICNKTEISLCTGSGDVYCYHLNFTLVPCSLPGGTSYLNLGTNLLTQIPVNAMNGSGYSSVSELDLSDNPLLFIEENTFASISSLQNLWLRGINNLTIFSGAFNGLSTSSIDLGCSNITTISSTAFPSQINSFLCGSNCENPETCSVDACVKACGLNSTCLINGYLQPNSNFSCLGSCNSTEIKECSINGIEFSCVDLGFTVLPCDLPANIDNLDLSSNMISQLYSGIFFGQGYPQLKQLNLNGNMLTVFNSGVFAALGDLQLLSLQNLDNIVIGSGAFHGLANASVNLACTRVSNISSHAFPKGFTFMCGSDCASTTTLCSADACTSACGKGSTCVVNDVISPSTIFTCVDGCDPSAEAKCSSVGSLFSCQDLDLSLVPCALPPNVTSLDLSNNNISVIVPSAFLATGYSSVEILDLSGNPLGTIFSDTFTGIDSLSSLTLVNIPNVVIDSGAFNGLQSTSEINLFNTYVFSIASDAFPSDIKTFVCTFDGSPATCSTDLCEKACGINSICIVNGYLSPKPTFLCLGNDDDDQTDDV